MMKGMQQNERDDKQRRGKEVIVREGEQRDEVVRFELKESSLEAMRKLEIQRRKQQKNSSCRRKSRNLKKENCKEKSEEEERKERKRTKRRNKEQISEKITE